MEKRLVLVFEILFNALVADHSDMICLVNRRCARTSMKVGDVTAMMQFGIGGKQQSSYARLCSISDLLCNFHYCQVDMTKVLRP